MPRQKTKANEPLAQELQRIFSELQVRPWPFYKKYKETGLKHATLKDALNALSNTSNTTLRLIAQTLAAEMVEAKGRGLIKETKTADELYRHFLDLQPIGAFPVPRSAPKRTKVSPSEICNWVTRNYGLLTEEEQLEAAPKLLAIVTRSMEKWRKGKNADPPSIWEAIQETMVLEGLGTIDDYAVWLLEQRCFLPKHPDRVPLTQGLEQIRLGGFPEIGSEVFATTTDYLSHFLSDFEGNSVKMLEFYGLSPSTAEVFSPPANNSRSA